jgi:hypothetical protein
MPFGASFDDSASDPSMICLMRTLQLGSLLSRMIAFSRLEACRTMSSGYRRAWQPPNSECAQGPEGHRFAVTLRVTRALTSSPLRSGLWHHQRCARGCRTFTTFTGSRRKIAREVLVNHEVDDAIARRVAVFAVIPSAVRGQPKGTVRAARMALAQVPLKELPPTPARFPAWLNDQTERVQRELPRGARHWGIARKVLNIYLRDALYNHYLRSRFALERAEHLYEIPLDQITADELIARDPALRWKGVKHLTPEVSLRFQHVAAEDARERGTARVHLDAIYWTPREGDRR